MSTIIVLYDNYVNRYEVLILITSSKKNRFLDIFKFFLWVIPNSTHLLFSTTS